MKKTTLFRLFCLAVLAVPASFGAFTVTAQPAQALQCAPTFLGCEYIGDVVVGSAVCCNYLCSNGRTRTGVCEQI
jgi:hypothetical protein